MRILRTLLFTLFAGVAAFANETPPDHELVLSLPEEVSSRGTNLLIRGLISPISSQLCLTQTDLVIRGAEEIRLTRIYTPPYIPYPLHDEKKHKKRWSQYSLYQHFSTNYKGWQFFPHTRLQVYPSQQTVRVSDPNGITLDYVVSDGETTFFSDSYGISNYSGGIPSGKYDPRNTDISFEEGGIRVVVRSSDGHRRIYRLRGRENLHPYVVYDLEKEVLPSGKVHKYHYRNGCLHSVESLSPDESIIYATLHRQGLPYFGERKWTSPTHDHVTYSYEKKPIDVELKNKSVRGHFPPILQRVNSPYYRKESIHYSEQFLLDHFDGYDKHFRCQYAIFGRGDSKHFKLEKLFFPDDPKEVCKIHYDPPIAGKKGGTTTVNHANGSQTIYRFTQNLMTEAIETFDEKGVLKLQKHFSWMDNGWLKSVEVADGKRHIFSKKTYEYDSFGNPIKETITGDLSGDGKTENYTLKREYSQDGKNLLIREEDEKGQITLFEYLPDTNLPTAKLIQDKSKILIREFYLYDKWNNLVQKIVDDGLSKDPYDLSGVTQKTWTEISLRQEAPFIHMPEQVEEKYLEDGEEKLAKQTRLTYDRRGNICQEDIYDSDGKFAYSIYKSYNERGDLLSETNPLGEKRIFSYDNKGRLIGSVSYSGKLSKIKTYDTQGRLIHESLCGIDGIKRDFSYVYNASDDLIEKSDGYGNKTRLTYDPISHKPTTCNYPKTLSPGGDILPVTTHHTYDPIGREIEKTDANGNTTRYKYNARGDKTEILYPDGAKESYRYYTNGKLKTYTNRAGLTIHYEYDTLGRMKSKQCCSDEQIAGETYRYNAFHLLSKTDKEGNITTFSYDGLGRKVEENFCGRIVEYRYDSLSRQERKIHHNGENTLIQHFERDLLDRILLEEKTNATGDLLYQIAYSYDADGNQCETIRYTNNEPHSEIFTYDSLGRITEHKDPLGNITNTIHDDGFQNAIGQSVLQKRITDPKGTQTIKTYDAIGRLVKREVVNSTGNPLASKEFSYDLVGNLLFERDHIYKNGQFQRTQTTGYRYYKSNLLKSYTRGLGTPNERTTFYTYTPSGKTASKTMPNGVTLTYGYDFLGHCVGLSSSDGTIDHRFERNRLGKLLSATDRIHHTSIKREIDSFGNVLSEQFSTGLSLEKKYDPLDRPTSLRIPNHGWVNFHYDPLYLKSVTRLSPAGSHCYAHTYDQYDLDGNLQAESLIKECGTIRHKSDAKGIKIALSSPHLEQVVTYDACGNLISLRENNQTIAFAYDDLNQLTAETASDRYSSFTYDSQSNRVQKDGVKVTYNQLDELQSQGSILCTYDRNGNLITKQTPNGTTHFTYDALNQLIKAKTPDTTIRFTYDPLGRRLSKETEKTIEHYLWDGRKEIGAFTQEGVLINLKVLGLHHPIAIENDSETFIPIHDVQGNIRILVNPLANTQKECYTYTAFGESSSNASLCPWRYVGKRWDPELNLYYFGKRYYDPQLARWTTLDPAGFVDGTNLYQYLYNNPYKYLDPDGEFIITLPLIIWGAGAAAPTLTAVGACLATGVATGAIAYGGYKLVEFTREYGWDLVTSWDIPRQYSQNGSIYKITDVYAPDRPLPRDPRTKEPVSEVNAPNTQLGTKDSTRTGEKYPQAREFDKDGQPVRDIDFTDHDMPDIHSNPHQHRHEPNKTGGTPERRPAKPLPEWKY